MSDPIPYRVAASGSTGSAPSGAIPIALYGAGGGGGGAVNSVNGKVGDVVLAVADIVGLEEDLSAHATWTALNAVGTATVEARAVADDALDLAEQAYNKVGTAVQSTDPRMAIVLTRAAYDALNPPVSGQVYYIQG